MTRQVAPARVAAHQVLRAVHHSRRDLATALATARRELDDPRDRALAGEIACGTLRWRNAIDHFLTQVSTRPIAKISPPILDLLRAATYQIHWLDRIPPHAVVADAVTLSRVIGKPRGAGFVNAVLRAQVNVQRSPVLSLPDAPASGADAENATGPLVSREPALAYLGVTLSHPRWLVARWLDRYGFDAAADWTRFNNGIPPVTLRPNLARISTSDLAAALAACDIRTTPARHAPHGLHVGAGDPAATPLAAKGLFVIQDEASQLILELVSPHARGTILDLCASPGNKTAGLAASRLEVPASSGRRQDDGDALIVACDHRPHRVSLLTRTRERLGLSNVAVVRLDATAPLPFGERFDHVLIDAPCSGLGIIRRDPDIKWRREPNDLQTFAERQLAMLRRAAACVRRGGRIVYSTCSSEPEENEDVVARFLKDRNSFTLVRPESPVARPFVDDAGYFRTLPFRDGVDAFFGAILRRKAA